MYKDKYDADDFYIKKLFNIKNIFLPVLHNLSMKISTTWCAIYSEMIKIRK